MGYAGMGPDRTFPMSGRLEWVMQVWALISDCQRVDEGQSQWVMQKPLEAY